MLEIHEFARRLAEAAVGRIAIRDFEEWLVTQSWDVHRWGGRALQEAVYAAELALAEYSNGHVDMSHVRVVLGDVASELARGIDHISSSKPGRVSYTEILRNGISANSIAIAA